MKKFIMSVRRETLKLLMMEAQKRDVRVQELLRAVIVPDWLRTNPDTSMTPPAQAQVGSQITAPSAFNLQPELVVPSSTSRSRRQRAIIRPSTRF